MKKFTIIASLAIVVVFIGVIIAVALMPDFKQPTLAAEGEDPDAPVWNMTMEDLIDYLVEKGLVDPSDRNNLTDGIASVAVTVGGADLYWWDLENLSEDSAEMKAYKEMMENGQVDLWGMGMYFMPLTKNGPFGLDSAHYPGNVKDLLDAFAAFGQKTE